jgi:hypothetical protein
LITYVHPSNYTIISSLFTDNGAGDDGGALFIGRTGSNVIVERSNFLQNHAADRGAAIAVFGSTMTIYHGTIIIQPILDTLSVLVAVSYIFQVKMQFDGLIPPFFRALPMMMVSVSVHCHFRNYRATRMVLYLIMTSSEIMRSIAAQW